MSHSIVRLGLALLLSWVPLHYPAYGEEEGWTFRYRCQVVYVVDGDTVGVVLELAPTPVGQHLTTGARIRLDGVLAPETTKRGMGVATTPEEVAAIEAEQRRGLEALRWVERWVRERTREGVEYPFRCLGQDEWTFSRWVGDVYGWRDLNRAGKPVWSSLAADVVASGLAKGEQ